MNLQKKIISTLGVKPSINPIEEFRVSVNFLKSYLKRYTNIRTLVLGISGGQDSTLTGKICQQAINEIRQESTSRNYQFIAVRLPYGEQIDEKDCQDAISFIRPDQTITINIKDIILINRKIFNLNGIVLNNKIKENEKSRERMKIQYSIASVNSGIVVGTSHAAEMVTGFFTKYGDGGVDINPLIQLNKRQIKMILQYLDCPNHLYLKKPIANTDEEQQSIPDESVLEITYETIDDYLEGKEVDIKSKKIIEELYTKTEHKRNLPINIFNKFWK